MAILGIGLLHFYFLLHLQEFNICQLIAYFLTCNFITVVGNDLTKSPTDCRTIQSCKLLSLLTSL